MPHEKGMTHDDWRRSKEDYLKCPSYTHPVYGTPLQEPYKPSKKRGQVTYKGIPVVPQIKVDIRNGKPTLRG